MGSLQGCGLYRQRANAVDKKFVEMPEGYANVCSGNKKVYTNLAFHRRLRREQKSDFQAWASRGKRALKNARHRMQCPTFQKGVH